MPTNTEYLKTLITTAGGDASSLPDNLETTLYKALIEALANGTGGGGEEWELITDITTEEKVSGITITEDMDGNPLNLKAVNIYLHSILPVGGGASVSQMHSVGFDEYGGNLADNKLVDFRIGKAPANEGDSVHISAIFEVDKTRGITLINNISSFNATSVQNMVYKNSYTEASYSGINTLPNIGKIFIRGSSLNVIGAGSRIRICGIRNK